MKYRLKDEHPDALKVQQVCQLMDDLKVSFTSYGCRSFVTVGDKEYYLEDVDDNSAVQDFPPFSEYKLCYEK